MHSHKTFIRLIIIGLLVFLLINTTSLALYQDSIQDNTYLEEPVPIIFGKMGENEWFITVVTISFEYNPDIVKEIQYNLNNKWNKYTSPFQVTGDGTYKISWFWIDLEDNNHPVEEPIGFKIDMTSPSIKLTKKAGAQNKVIFTAATSDEVSLIDHVEFYLDNILIQNDTTSPYQYTWTGSEEKHIVYAISYNYAGLLIKSDNLSTIPRSRFRTYILMDLIFTLIQKILIPF